MYGASGFLVGMGIIVYTEDPNRVSLLGLIVILAFLCTAMLPTVIAITFNDSFWKNQEELDELRGELYILRDKLNHLISKYNQKLLDDDI